MRIYRKTENETKIINKNINYIGNQSNNHQNWIGTHQQQQQQLHYDKITVCNQLNNVWLATAWLNHHNNNEILAPLPKNILYTKVFGTTSFSLTVEGMGPYPLSDSTNLLGPTSTSYASRGGVGGGVVGSSACYTNYGTNITPVPNRKQCYYNESDYGRDDTFRRHSAHGRMSCRLKQSNS